MSTVSLPYFFRMALACVTKVDAVSIRHRRCRYHVILANAEALLYSYILYVKQNTYLSYSVTYTPTSPRYFHRAVIAVFINIIFILYNTFFIFTLNYSISQLHKRKRESLLLERNGRRTKYIEGTNCTYTHTHQII